MGAMLTASLAVPHAFGDDAWLFVGAYVAVRLAHLVLYALVGRGDRELLGAIVRLSYGTIAAAVLLVAGAAIGGNAQIALWAVAIVIDMLGAFVRGSRGWHLGREHFAERHGLIIIIALGESIVAVGVGALGVTARRRRRRRGAARARDRRARSGGRTSTSSRSRRSGGCAAPRAWRRSRSRATRTATYTCRWSPGSSSSRSA